MKINKLFKYPYKFDYFYVFTLIIISIVIIFLKTRINKTKQSVIIESSLQTIILNIYHDTIIDIEGVNGISKIEISSGKVRFLSSPCKNKLCVKRGFLSNSGDNFACVPNRVSIRISNNEGLDAISR